MKICVARRQGVSKGFWAHAQAKKYGPRRRTHQAVPAAAKMVSRMAPRPQRWHVQHWTREMTKETSTDTPTTANLFGCIRWEKGVVSRVTREWRMQWQGTNISCNMTHT